MASEGDITTKASNVRLDGGKNHCRERKNSKKNEETSFEPISSKALTSYSPLTAEVSDYERGEQPVDITLRIEWIARVDATG